jgi:hypothetical protein
LKYIFVGRVEKSAQSGHSNKIRQVSQNFNISVVQNSFCGNQNS